MDLMCVTPPSYPFLTAAGLAAHLRIDSSFENSVVAALSASVSTHLDGRDGLLGRAILTQTWRLSLDRFPRENGPFANRKSRAIVLPLPPLQAVSSVTYLDESNVQQTLQPGTYVVLGTGGHDAARVVPAHGTEWPCTLDFPGAVTVTFRAGYGDIDDVPSPIMLAAKMTAATWFQNRESVVVGNFSARELPQGALDLLMPYREFEF